MSAKYINGRKGFEPHCMDMPTKMQTGHFEHLIKEELPHTANLD